MRTRNKLIAVAALSFLIIIGFVVFYPTNIGYVSHAGKVTFYAIGLAPEDTTNYDGAGTLDVCLASSPFTTLETLTYATDTTTRNVYSSGQTYFFVSKSTTASAADYFVFKVQFPFANAAEDPNGLWSLIWVEGNPGTWTLTLKQGLETQPTLLGYKDSGAVWGAAGTDSYTFTTTVNMFQGNLYIAIGVNYGGLFSFFDPEETGGIYDGLFLVLTQNTSAANQGLFVQGSGWKQCAGGHTNDYYFDVGAMIANGAISGALMRYDQKGVTGVIVVPITYFCNGDLDTSGGGDTIITITLYEGICDEQAANQVVAGDTVDNFSTDPTAEQCEFTDGN